MYANHDDGGLSKITTQYDTHMLTEKMPAGGQHLRANMVCLNMGCCKILSLLLLSPPKKISIWYLRLKICILSDFDEFCYCSMIFRAHGTMVAVSSSWRWGRPTGWFPVPRLRPLLLLPGKRVPRRLLNADWISGKRRLNQSQHSLISGETWQHICKNEIRQTWSFFSWFFQGIQT